jgi:type II secretory pathway pseudopilin PulG
MRINKFLKTEDSFTLVELLVVIGILAILTAAVVIVLNPAELLKQSRDSKRTTDLASLNNAIKLLLTQNPDVSLGSASTVYISLPATNADCSDIASTLPPIPSDWQYRCVTAANSQKTDGTGWIPVSFAAAGGVASLSALPLDPQNTLQNFYSYIPGGSWELMATFESRKYQPKAQNDGGVQPGAIEVGTNLALSYVQGATCNAIKTANPSATDGIYWIRPNALPAAQVFCDMTTDGGGWTLVLNNGAYPTPPKPNWIQGTTQNTITGTISSSLDSFDQILGVGYWNDIGSSMRLEQGASHASLSHKATYTFSLNSGDYYRLSMSNQAILLTATGTATPGIYSYHNGAQFVAYDRAGGNCAGGYSQTPWWYRSCWSGSYWGGGDVGGYRNAPFWTGSTDEYFPWGGIWIK